MTSQRASTRRRLVVAGSSGLAAPDATALEFPSFAAEPTAAVAPAGRRAWFPGANRDAVYKRILALADALAAACAVIAAIEIAGNGGFNFVMLCAVPLIVIMSGAIGTYDREDLLVRKSTLDEAPALFQLAALYALVAWLLYGFITAGDRGARQLAALWIGTFLLLLLFRGAARMVARAATAPERCLVIGDQKTCDWMQVKFARRTLHATVVGRVLPARREPLDHAIAEDVRVEDLQAVVQRLDVDRIIITPGRADEDGVVNVVHAATSLGLKVSVLPRVLQVIGSSSEFDDVDGVPLLSVRPLRLPRSARFAKRTLDIIGSTIGLLILSPVLIAIAIAIKLDSNGRVLFRQSRIGRDGAELGMLKFRTMVDGADEQKSMLHHLNQAEGLFKIADDPRITRLGRWLRRSSLDELPQLLNVLRGEMSLVGPRPLVADEDSRLEGWRRRRLHLTPGMTGHWQILGSARIPLEEMARIDYLYVSSWSLWLDIKILLRTIPYVFSGKGM